MLITAHVVVWLAGAVALQAVAAWLLGVLGPVEAVLAGLAVALVWQVTPTVQPGSNRHHICPPLAAFGPAADRELLSFGTHHAVECLGACWALMLLPALSGSFQVVVMALCSVWVWAQALESPAKPRWRLRLPVRARRLIWTRWRATAQPR